MIVTIPGEAKAVTKLSETPGHPFDSDTASNLLIKINSHLWRVVRDNIVSLTQQRVKKPRLRDSRLGVMPSHIFINLVTTPV